MQMAAGKPMNNHTLKLTDREVLEFARIGLERHLPLKAEGYKCSTDDLLNALLGVCVSGDTLESVCADLEGTPGAETIRQYLHQQLTADKLPELEKSLNAALAAEVPSRVWRRARDSRLNENAELGSR